MNVIDHTIHNIKKMEEVFKEAWNILSKTDVVDCKCRERVLNVTRVFRCRFVTETQCKQYGVKYKRKRALIRECLVLHKVDNNYELNGKKFNLYRVQFDGFYQRRKTLKQVEVVFLDKTRLLCLQPFTILNWWPNAMEEYTPPKEHHQKQQPAPIKRAKREAISEILVDEMVIATPSSDTSRPSCEKQRTPTLQERLKAEELIPENTSESSLEDEFNEIKQYIPLQARVKMLKETEVVDRTITLV